VQSPLCWRYWSHGLRRGIFITPASPNAAPSSSTIL
jgi:hypothetical protein